MSSNGSPKTGQLRSLREARRRLLREQQPEHYCTDCHSVTFESEEQCLECTMARPGKGWSLLEEANDPWLGRTINDRYIIAKPLGHGTSGDVYRAESLSISRQFAIKIIATDKGHTQAEQIIARLNREIEALSRLRNPHIVSFYEIFDLRGNHVAAVMDLIDGTTLEALVVDGEPLSVTRACALLRQIANGIYEAHQAGMIHRDLKPDNLMVERLPAGDDFMHILDFGIVRLTDDSSVNLTHGFIGTPLYASPEQAMAKAIDHRSDIYSLGAILFFMLTGQPPFASNNVYEVLRMHVRKTAPTLSEIYPQGVFPQALEELTARMLAKQPDSRPDDLSQVIEELDNFSRSQISDAQFEPSSTNPKLPKIEPGEPVRTPTSGVLKVPKDFDPSKYDRDKETSSATLQAYGQRKPSHTPAFLRTPTPAPSNDQRLNPLPGEIKFGAGGPDESSAATAIPSATYKIQTATSKIKVAHRSDGCFAIVERAPRRVLLFQPQAAVPTPFDVSSPETIKSIALSSTHLIVGHTNGTISSVEIERGREESLYQDVRRVPITAVATDRDSTCIVAGSSSGRVYLHRNKQNSTTDWRRIRSGDDVRGIAMSNSTDTVAIARQDNSVELIGLANPRVPAGKFRVAAPVRSMAISPDNYLLAAALVDRSIALFQIPTGQQVMSLQADDVDVLAVHFSDNGKPVAICSVDSQLRVLQFDQINSHVSS